MADRVQSGAIICIRKQTATATTKYPAKGFEVEEKALPAILLKNPGTVDQADVS